MGLSIPRTLQLTMGVAVGRPESLNSLLLGGSHLTSGPDSSVSVPPNAFFCRAPLPRTTKTNRDNNIAVAVRALGTIVIPE
jgi:hypothetical protein